MKIKGALLILFVWIVSSQNLFAQIKGQVSDQNGTPIYLANVYWLSDWVSAQTDENGKFVLSNSKLEKDTLIVDAQGYEKYFLPVISKDTFYRKIILISTKDLKEVEVKVRRGSTFIQSINPIKTQIISVRELNKSACCNLSEAFENNISVDVMNGDALSGAKQLRLMGLEGIYTYIMRENQAQVRGISLPFTMDMIPGTWLENIQLNTGTGSVVHGHESISGNINFEYQKPDKSELLFANLFLNTNGRNELNINTSHIINDKLSTGLYTHVNYVGLEIDRNDDTFRDLPLRSGIALMNRWKYNSERFSSNFGAIYLNDNRQGGQLNFFSNNPYVANFKNNRLEFFSKNAILYPSKPHRGLGFNASVSLSNLDSKIGNEGNILTSKKYIASQFETHFLAMYRTQIVDARHTVKVGVSSFTENFKEDLNQKVNSFKSDSIEITPGAFVEYTYAPNTIFTILMSNRVDYYFMKKMISSPKLFIKYQLNEKNTIRLMAGRGFRKSYLVAENISQLISPKYFNFNSQRLNPEIAWNYGINYVYDFIFLKNNAQVSIDFSSTQFTHQNILDFNTTNDFYSINPLQRNDQSYSNAAQIELNNYIGKYFEMKLAYRANISKTTYTPGRSENKMMLPRSKTLFNLSYTSNYEKWKANFTIVRNGKVFLPENHQAGQNHADSKAYLYGLAQASRVFLNWDIYVGVENVFNFTQDTPIIRYEDTAGNVNYDGTQIWAPMIGRTFYFGVRYKLD